MFNQIKVVNNVVKPRFLDIETRFYMIKYDR